MEVRFPEKGDKSTESWERDVMSEKQVFHQLFIPLLFGKPYRNLS
jgi:hypothetical protein